MAAILVVPLGARQFGVPAVVAVIAGISVLLIVSTLCRPFGFRPRLTARRDRGRVVRIVDEAERGPDLATAIAQDNNTVGGGQSR